MGQWPHVRGQRLFIRPIETTDQAEIDRFLARLDRPSTASRKGLIGKLVGDLVAVLAVEESDADIHVRDLVVAPDLRRKRIGRFMIDELVLRSRSSGSRRIILDPNCAEAGFFERVGFLREKYHLVRTID